MENEKVTKQSIEINPAQRRVECFRESSQHMSYGDDASRPAPALDLEEHLKNVNTIINKLIHMEAQRVSFDRYALLGVLQDLVAFIRSCGTEHYIFRTELEIDRLTYTATLTERDLLMHNNPSVMEHLKEQVMRSFMEKLSEHIQMVESVDDITQTRTVHAELFVAKRNT